MSKTVPWAVVSAGLLGDHSALFFLNLRNWKKKCAIVRGEGPERITRGSGRPMWLGDAIRLIGSWGAVPPEI